MGHFFTAKLFKWKVDKISLYPYGGVSSFKEDLNKPLKEEFLILIMGPFLQIVFFLILKSFISSSTTLEILTNYHYSLLFFNLLPVYPLDGGRLLQLIFSLFSSYKKSYHLSLLFSFFTLFFISTLLGLDLFSTQLFLVIILLLSKLIEAYKKRNFYYQRFLLERYLKNYNFIKVKKVDSVDKMMRDHIHLVKEGEKYVFEKRALAKYFKSSI